MTFLNATTYTENCYQCQYARIERSGDITLGDSWGSDLEKSIQDKGVSLVLCQNEKGKELINQTDLTNKINNTVENFKNMVSSGNN